MGSKEVSGQHDQHIRAAPNTISAYIEWLQSYQVCRLSLDGFLFFASEISNIVLLMGPLFGLVRLSVAVLCCCFHSGRRRRCCCCCDIITTISVIFCFFLFVLCIIMLVLLRACLVGTT
jgi:hypothetical protein